MIINRFTQAAVLASLVVLCIIPIPGTANADSGDGSVENPYSVPFSQSAITIDGLVSEEEWQQSLMLELPYETSPGENIPAPVRTEVFLIYGSERLYVAFRCYDPNPSAIRAHLTDRDAMWDDDNIWISFDTFNDERRSFAFGTNALGIQGDSVRINFTFDESWDAIWDSAGRIYEWGFAVEMAIPFKQLRFQRANDPQVWGLEAGRTYPRSVDHIMRLTPLDRSNNCFQCQMVKIKGFVGVDPGRNIEVVPTLTAIRTDVRAELPHGKREKQTQDAEAGLTAKWGMTPNLTLSSTYNPDFSQVEADAVQLDINEPFALWYSEKRPFFVEGSDFFSTPLNVVYTRTMRDPSWGIKLTGKEKGHTIGVYFVRDELTNLIFPGNQDSKSLSLGMDSTAAVFRYKKDIGNRYTLGGFLTDREGNNYFNRVYGADGQFRFTQTDLVSVQILGSSTNYPVSVARQFGQKEENFSDMAVALQYSHNARNLDWDLRYRHIGPDFRTDLGFIPRVGIRDILPSILYTWIGGGDRWFSFLQLGGAFNQINDHRGNLLMRSGWTVFQYSGPLQSSLYILYGQFKEFFKSQPFEGYWMELRHSLWPTGNLHLSVYSVIGEQIDYVNTRLGKRALIEGNLRYLFGKHLSLNFSHTFEKFSVKGGRLYTANISQASLYYHFSTRFFFRYTLQHILYDYNSALYLDSRDPRLKRFFNQLLFSYKLNPQTVLFIGYSDNYLGNQDFGLTQTDRTFFIKLGYAWLL